MQGGDLEVTYFDPNNLLEEAERTKKQPRVLTIGYYKWNHYVGIKTATEG